MIKQIETLGSKLVTPEGEYVMIEMLDISDGAIFAVVTNNMVLGKDEQNVMFYPKPYLIMASGNWQLEFRDVPDIIYIWQEEKSIGGDTMK